MISIANIPRMRTWRTSSKDVFSRLVKGVEVKGGRAVLEVFFFFFVVVVIVAVLFFDYCLVIICLTRSFP